jgi:AcrR family transcriptional regulator
MSPGKVIRDDRLESILEAAQALIAASGVESVSMAQLGKTTGLSRPAIYQYFSSKEDVLAELVINEMADLSNAIDSLLFGPPGQCRSPNYSANFS